MASGSGRLGRIVRDVAGLSSLAARDGLRSAVAQRLRSGLDIEHVDSGLMGAALAEIDGVKEQQRRQVEDDHSLAHGAAVTADRVSGLEVALAASGAQQAEQARATDAAAADLAELAARSDALERRLAGMEEARSLDRAVALHTRWLRHAPASERVISVILATRDRPHELAHAVRSVQAQTHTAWELLVIDDSTGDEGLVARLVAELGDERIRALRSGAGNVAVARNAGLAAARGDLIAYLDDDNFWYPEWLAAVAAAYERHPDAPLVYGGLTRSECTTDIWLPAWDRRRLERANCIDQNVLAHRRDHPEARFSEDLAALVDWDLVLRLTDDEPAVPISVLAAGYTTGAPDRISARTQAVRAADAEIRRRTWARRPLRVLGLNPQFPLLSETYILDELTALARRGAQLGFVRTNAAVAPMRIPWPQWQSLDAAVAEWDPDVAVLHWAASALHLLAGLERYELPFAVRSHSFDVDPESSRACVPIRSASACGRIRPPRRASRARSRCRCCSPPRIGCRRHSGRAICVISASALLPKKDFPLLFDAFARMPDVDRRIVVAATQGHEELPGVLLQRCEELEDPPLVQVNLPREDVFALLSRTALFVYTLEPERPFGMPMSVAEAMASGCSVVLPDRPACREYAGPSARYYADAQDIARHAHEALAGGPAIAEERRLNRAWALRRFCDPVLGEGFHRELTTALARVRGEVAVDTNGRGTQTPEALAR